LHGDVWDVIHELLLIIFYCGSSVTDPVFVTLFHPVETEFLWGDVNFMHTWTLTVLSTTPFLVLLLFAFCLFFYTFSTA
jgi:hypothetical protein